MVGGGDVTGIYYHAALQICVVVNRHAGDRYHCVARPALGSVFNIDAVERGLLDFGVAQSDRQWQATHGEGEWRSDGTVDKLRSVLSLHEETVLLVARRDKGIETVRDLEGRSVNLGNEGSGHRGNAEDVLRLYGLDPVRDLLAFAMPPMDASSALIDGQIDAFFYTVGNPSTAVEDPAESADVHLVPLDAEPVRRFVAERPWYVMTRVPTGTYRGVDAPVATYATLATLVTSAELDAEVVYDVVRTVFEHLDEVRAGHPALRSLDAKAMLRGLSAPLHPGAERYYRERGWR